MLEYIQHFFLNNQFASGGMLMVLFGGLLAYIQAWPQRIWDYTLSCVTVTLSIYSNDPLFSMIEEWLAIKDYGKKCRRVMAFTKREVLISPDLGSHLIFYKWRPIWLSKVENSQQIIQSDSTRSKQTYNFRFFCLRKALVIDFIKEIVETTKIKDDDKISVWSYTGDWWQLIAKKNKRPITSIAGNAIINELTLDLEKFLNKKDWYSNLGIPYKRTYLLHGPPGNGKSSIIHAIASYLNRDIAILDLNNMTDRGLIGVVSEFPANSILVIEEVDCLNLKRKTKEKKFLNISTVLNVLDGIFTPDGLITFMTTNHIEELDHALIREGRVDVKKELVNPDIQTGRELFNKFFPDESPHEHYLNLIDGTTSVSKLQEALIQEVKQRENQ